MAHVQTVRSGSNDYEDQTGQRWRTREEPPEEPEPPLAKLGNLSRPATPDMAAFRKLNMRGRAEVICKYWVTEGFGSSVGMLLFYVFKTAAFPLVWWKCCSPYPRRGCNAALKSWGKDAFKRAVLLWTLWELLGIGCNCGPLNGRILPSPVVAPAYFLRPGAIKRPIGPAAWLPRWINGGDKRTSVDVALYISLVATLANGLRMPLGSITATRFRVLAALFGVATLRDATMVWAARCDHSIWCIFCLMSDRYWLTGSKLVQVAIWFFAGLSKLGPWFPYVVMGMISNSAAMQVKSIRALTVQSLDTSDLRPSTLVKVMAHGGTLMELTFPLVLATSQSPVFDASGVILPVTSSHFGVLISLAFHSFIISNIPMGAPLEWNVFCMISSVLLFGLHGGVSMKQLGSLPPLMKVLMLLLFFVPLYGNIFPKGISFLVAMRYYAGNWPATMWIWKRSAEHKWQRLLEGRAVCKPMHEQVGAFFKSDITMCAEWRGYSFRAMQLHGRMLPGMLRMILKGQDMDDWRYNDGELVAGIVLGWNFGDAYLHDSRLLKVVQEHCNFKEGELYHIMIESCPLGGSAFPWEIRDASQPEEIWAQGSGALKDLEEMQPY